MSEGSIEGPSRFWATGVEVGDEIKGGLLSAYNRGGVLHLSQRTVFATM